MASSTDSVVEMVEMIAKALVDEPDAVEVQHVSGERSSVLELSVAQDDLGKIIGKKGRTAKSIRTLLGAVSMKMDRRFSLEIIEP